VDDSKSFINFSASTILDQWRLVGCLQRLTESL
jgi:hypothetical protein